MYLHAQWRRSNWLAKLEKEWDRRAHRSMNRGRERKRQRNLISDGTHVKMQTHRRRQLLGQWPAATRTEQRQRQINDCHFGCPQLWVSLCANTALATRYLSLSLSLSLSTALLSPYSRPRLLFEPVGYTFFSVPYRHTTSDCLFVWVHLFNYRIYFFF